jgi:hypothetical protein
LTSFSKFARLIGSVSGGRPLTTIVTGPSVDSLFSASVPEHPVSRSVPMARPAVSAWRRFIAGMSLHRSGPRISVVLTDAEVARC